MRTAVGRRGAPCMGVTITSGVSHTAAVALLGVLCGMMVSVGMRLIGARSHLGVGGEALVMGTGMQRETLAHRAEHEGERPEQGGTTSSRRRTGW